MPCGAGEEPLLCLTFLPVTLGSSSCLDLLALASSSAVIIVATVDLLDDNILNYKFLS